MSSARAPTRRAPSGLPAIGGASALRPRCGAPDGTPRGPGPALRAWPIHSEIPRRAPVRTPDRRSRVKHAWLALAVTLAAASPAAAMTVDPAPLETLAAEATAVVRGHVVDSETGLSPTGRIETRVGVAIWEVVKGPLEIAVAHRLVVILPGGTHGGLRTVVPGVPVLRPGDELVLLLVPARPGSWWPIGYRLGVLAVDDRGRLVPTGAAPSIPGDLRWDTLREAILSP